MADLCPDPDAYAHSGCGYPSGAQPDTYVNEEWFGLFAIHRAPCQTGDLNQIRARDAWFRLKLLWAKGSCLGFYGLNETLQPYNASEWPECGPEISRQRAEMEECKRTIKVWEARKTGDCADFETVTDCDWYCWAWKADCQSWQERAESETCRGWNQTFYDWDGDDCAVMHFVEKTTGVCPPVPEHMRDLNASMTWEKENWVDRPEVCLSDSELWFAANGGYIITTVLGLLALMIINARRISKMATEWMPRFYMTQKWVRKLRRVLGVRRGQGKLLASLNASAAERAAPDEDLVASLAGPLSRIMRPPAPQGYLSADARRARNARIHALLLPIADQLATCFGLQKTQQDFFLGQGLEEVPLLCTPPRCTPLPAHHPSFARRCRPTSPTRSTTSSRSSRTASTGSRATGSTSRPRCAKRSSRCTTSSSRRISAGWRTCGCARAPLPAAPR